MKQIKRPNRETKMQNEKTACDDRERTDSKDTEKRASPESAGTLAEADRSRISNIISESKMAIQNKTYHGYRENGSQAETRSGAGAGTEQQ